MGRSRAATGTAAVSLDNPVSCACLLPLIFSHLNNWDIFRRARTHCARLQLCLENRSVPGEGKKPEQLKCRSGCLLENIGERPVRVQDKRGAAPAGTCTHAEMTIVSKIFMDDDRIIPLAQGTCRKVMVNHTSQCMGSGKNRNCGRGLTAGFPCPLRCSAPAQGRSRPVPQQRGGARSRAPL